MDNDKINSRAVQYIKALLWKYEDRMFADELNRLFGYNCLVKNGARLRVVGSKLSEIPRSYKSKKEPDREKVVDMGWRFRGGEGLEYDFLVLVCLNSSNETGVEGYFVIPRREVPRTSLIQVTLNQMVNRGKFLEYRNKLEQVINFENKNND
jgi:hypothetical protein